MSSNYKHLMNDCNSDGSCCKCAEPVKKRELDGRWFITMNHPGFNSAANNRDGYETKESAVAAYKRYAAKGNK